MGSRDMHVTSRPAEEGSGNLKISRKRATASWSYAAGAGQNEEIPLLSGRACS